MANRETYSAVVLYFESNVIIDDKYSRVDFTNRNTQGFLTKNFDKQKIMTSLQYK